MIGQRGDISGTKWEIIQQALDPHVGDIFPADSPLITGAFPGQFVRAMGWQYGVHMPLMIRVKKGVYMDPKQGSLGIEDGGHIPPQLTLKLGVIATLSKGYTLIDPEGIYGVISGVPGLLDLLVETPQHLGDYFPGQALSLAPMDLLIARVEGKQEEETMPPLLLRVHTPWDAKRFWRQAQRFSYEWWLSHWNHWVCLLPSFRPLEESLRYDARGKDMVMQQSVAQDLRQEEGDPV